MISPNFQPATYFLQKSAEAKFNQATAQTDSSLPPGSYSGSFRFLIKNSIIQQVSVLSRKELENEILRLYSTGGYLNKLLSDTTQHAFLSAAERALYHRSQSPCRALIHAAGRFKGHSSNDGIFKDLYNQIAQTDNIS